ncbi:hypothetical protein [Pseudomonas cremoricolorata]|uniref:hypothetical protein n=1 Tax=Pseudomonas cremoricolorata TaxID=157783 RepID=UPI0012B61F5A|nr:hypothetical protein [Pseudomonas cremoricolorata]
MSVPWRQILVFRMETVSCDAWMNISKLPAKAHYRLSAKFPSLAGNEEFSWPSDVLGRVGIVMKMTLKKVAHCCDFFPTGEHQ